MATFEIWYMRPEFFRDGSMGFDWLKERGKVPNVWKLTDTHIHVKTIDAASMETTFRMMQAEEWSPNGEARELIQAKGLEHTSMSVGDIVVELRELGATAHIVDRFGFADLS